MLNTIQKADCVEFLDSLDDSSVDLAVLDPPYNMGKAAWDTYPDHIAFMNEMMRVFWRVEEKLKGGGSLYIFNTPLNNAYFLTQILGENAQPDYLTFRKWITWDKRDGQGNATNNYKTAQETILFFTKGNNYTFNADAIRIPYDSASRIAAAAKTGIIKNGKRWYPNEHGKVPSDVWHITSERHKNKVNGKTQKLAHITPKPLDMIERIIKASSNEGDVVLDCFVGSGTTALAAQRLKRNFLACDSNAEYVEVARQRLADDKNKGQMI